jgi:LuxR family maltose regulon positive regulatory protein
MTNSPAQGATAVSDLVLKVTPPRVPRDLLMRSRLSSDKFRDSQVILIQAPAGFGKTSLLAQWRREHLARGAVVAWISAQSHDDPQRFLASLALAVRVASGRPAFGQTLLAAMAGLEGFTAWLAEVAQSELDVVLLIDEADRLPPATRESLAYLLHNAPQNLKLVVAARPWCDLDVSDMVQDGHCVTVTAETMRLNVDEVLALGRARIGERFDLGDGAVLHELAEGWPLGVQLAMAAAERGPSLHAAIASLSTRKGQLHEHFIGVLLSNLGTDDIEFLTRIALLDHLHPDLCRALVQDEAAPARLARLARETPIFVASEDGDWLRMHNAARDVLRTRIEALPAFERAQLHRRASLWLADQGLLEAAAEHALAAGEREQAYDLAERSLYEALMRQGHVGAVLDWLARMPGAELDRRPRLLLTAAWALAVSGRLAEAEQGVTRVLARPVVSDALRCECALILSGAAGFADDPDRFAELHDPWADNPPLADPVLLYVQANRKAFRALFAGDPARARHHQQQAPRGDFDQAFGYVARWGDLVNGLSYLWEGQALQAQSILQPALTAAESDLGRRGPFVCMLAALLAAASWDLDRPREAAALLANRLDVLERSGLPDSVLLGYRTAARFAAAEGAEPRALELLEALHAVGLSRQLPRLCIASLADQVRLHAGRFRAQTCTALCHRIDAILAREDCPRGPLWRRGAQQLQTLAHAFAAIAAQDWPEAQERLTTAGTLAEAMNLGRVRIEVMALRAWVLDHLVRKSTALLQEALDLASTHGLARLCVDAHPALGDWAQKVGQPSGSRPSGPSVLAPPARPLATTEARTLRVVPSMALTPKEREVLDLLARNLSNKEIALALHIGEATIKWHMSNLFVKLNADGRKQVVRRAELLGLLEQPAQADERRP